MTKTFRHEVGVVYIKPVTEEELKRYESMDEDGKDNYSDALLEEITKGAYEVDSRRQANGLPAEYTSENKPEIQMEINLYYQETVTETSFQECQNKFNNTVKELLSFLDSDKSNLINFEGQGRTELIDNDKNKELSSR